MNTREIEKNNIEAIEDMEETVEAMELLEEDMEETVEAMELPEEDMESLEEYEDEENADIYADQSNIKSKERVKEHGEVYTPENIVKDMMNLDGVREESYRLDSRFLEPSCGNGNFLVEIVRRKLESAKNEAATDDNVDGLDIEKYNLNVVRAMCSIYGVDIMGDNIQQARQRMMSITKAEYSKVTGSKMSPKLEKAVAFVMSRNIVLGNTLKHTMVEYDMYDEKGKECKAPIDQVPDDCKGNLVFYEWHFKGSKVNRGVYRSSDMNMEYSGDASRTVNYLNISDLYFDEENAEELEY